MAMITAWTTLSLSLQLNIIAATIVLYGLPLLGLWIAFNNAHFDYTLVAAIVCFLAGLLLKAVSLIVGFGEERRERQLRKSYLAEEHFGLWP